MGKFQVSYSTCNVSFRRKGEKELNKQNFLKEIIGKHFQKLVKNITDPGSSLSSNHNKLKENKISVCGQKTETEEEENIFKATKEDMRYTGYNDMNN